VSEPTIQQEPPASESQEQEPPASESQEQEPPASESQASSLRLRPSRIAKAISAAVAFSATATGLVFGLWPALRPEMPPATKGATLSHTTVDHITFGQYLDRTATSRSGYRRAQLDRQGVLVSFDVDVKGYRTKRLPLQWQLIDARTGDRIARWTDHFLTPEANEDQGRWPIWVAVPRGHTRRFFIEVELLDDRGLVPLGHIRTQRVSGT
jgi:hypothetical protein